MSLKVWLPLDGDLRNLGASEIKWICSAVTDSGGKIGQCYYFSGSTYITENTYDWTNFNNKQFSVCCWYKEPSVASGNSQMICIGTNSGWNNIRIGLLRRNGNGYPMFSVSDGSTAIQYGFTATAFTLNTWNHIAVTYDNGNLSMYINGILDKTMTTTIIPVLNSSQHLGIGAASNGAEKLLGYLNDVRIYDHCLSAAEVKEISQGLVLHYKLNDAVGFTDLIARNTNVTAYNNHGNTNNPTTITYLKEQYNGDRIIQYSATPNSSVINSIQGTLHSHGIYNWSKTFKANTKYVFWIYYKPITHLDTVAGGTASNIGGWTEIPPVAVGDGWYRVGQYRNGTVTTDKTDSIFVSYKTPSAVAGDNIIIYFASPHLIEGTIEIPPYDYPSTIIQDSSGYNHNGTIIGNPYIIANSARYQNAMYFIDRPCAINSVSTFSHLNTFTYSCWFKRSTNEGAFLIMGYQYGNNSSGSLSIVSDKPGFHYYAHANGNGDTQVGITQTCNDNQWHHLAATYDGTKVISYFDGVKTAEQNVTLLTTTRTFSINYTNTGSSNRDYQGALSDARVYCTALDADAIRQLYEIGAKIDNKQNWHAYEFIDSNTEKVKKTGQTLGHTIIETYLPAYDKNIYTEPDGSTWIHIFHHNNPAASKFDEPTLNWPLGKYLDTDRWYDVDRAVTGALGPYEFMIKQKTTSDATETKYRWIQTANPLTAVWNDVKPGTPTFITTTGYTSSSMGGLYIFKTSQLHMSIANGSSSNWYGGIGCAAAYNGGIPGYPNTTVTTGYIDLYMRVYNGAKIIKNIGINASQIIEL